MLRKGPLGAISTISNTINTRKRNENTNGMTLGGEKKPTMLKKGPRCWVYSMKHNQYWKKE
jgi:hypothetical protein